MGEYYAAFSALLGIKKHPNDYERSLFEKTRRYGKYISWIPGLKMVAICNSLSMYATKGDGSDIDLFIITAPKRMWYVRLMVTFIFQILGVRRHGKKIKDRFCLSFFITEKAMDFSTFAIKNDIYLFYWIYFLKPIINKDSAYERFIEANSRLGIDPINLHGDNRIYLIKSGKHSYFDDLKLLDLKDYILKKIFLPITLSKGKKLCNQFGTIVSDDILKYHDNDKRIQIRDSLT